MIDGGLPAGRGVVAGIKGEVLRPVGLGLRTLQHQRLNGRVQELVIRDIGASDHHRKRAAMALDQEGALHATLRAVGRVRPDMAPPFRALPIAPSAACHPHSTPSRSSHRSIRTAQSCSNTPACFQRWNARWTVLSSGYSAGNRFH